MQLQSNLIVSAVVILYFNNQGIRGWLGFVF